MYPMASADSLAVNLVVAPSSFAMPDRASISPAVAPDRASTLDIDASKSPATVTHSM